LNECNLQVNSQHFI